MTRNLEYSLSQIALHPAMFRPDFGKWLQVNHHVYMEFNRLAEVVWKAGWRHYSARTIMENIRHRSNVRELFGDYKINNIRIPCCARLYALNHPERAILFEFRRNDLRAA